MNTKPRSTRLLVSVRNAAEAKVALSAEVDLIDIKEPARGTLGPADVSEIEAVLQRVGARLPVSAARGELLTDIDAVANVPPELTWAKIGLAGCDVVSHWPDRWWRAVQRWPASVGRVAVVYADHQAAKAPSPPEILDLAKQFQCAAVLVDTFDKSTGGLFSYWTDVQLASFTQRVRAGGMLAVAGGSLDMLSAPRAAAAGVDVVAVRSAACRAGRISELDAAKIDQLSRCLQTVCPSR